MTKNISNFAIMSSAFLLVGMLVVLLGFGRISNRTALDLEANGKADALNVGAEAENRQVSARDVDVAEVANEENDAAEQSVDTFYSETDNWADPDKSKLPTMTEVNAFVEKFRRVPRARKAECLQRALNLIPDQNVMLLVGILMDKREEKEFVALVYNDVLNRSEDVKKPILQEIFQDKTHPCWSDTAWILEVTGEKPES